MMCYYLNVQIQDQRVKFSVYLSYLSDPEILSFMGQAAWDRVLRKLLVIVVVKKSNTSRTWKHFAVLMCNDRSII